MEPANSVETAERSRTVMKALVWIAAVAAVMLFLGGLTPRLALMAKLAAYVWLMTLVLGVAAVRFWAGLPLEQRYDDPPTDEVHRRQMIAWILIPVGAVSLISAAAWFQNEIGLGRLMVAAFELLALWLSAAGLWWVVRDALEGESAST